MSTHQPIGKLLSLHCKRKNLNIEDFHFYYTEVEIFGWETPASLAMENEDTIIMQFDETDTEESEEEESEEEDESEGIHYILHLFLHTYLFLVVEAIRLGGGNSPRELFSPKFCPPTECLSEGSELFTPKFSPPTTSISSFLY